MGNLKEFMKTKIVKKLPYVGRAFIERDNLRNEMNRLIRERDALMREKKAGTGHTVSHAQIRTEDSYTSASDYRKGLVDLYINASGNASTVISPNDEMYNNLAEPGRHIVHYMFGGRTAFKAIISAISMANAQKPGRILDFPSGHGRVLRFLRAGFPKAEIVACDIDNDGINFCASEFGAVPVMSQTDISKVELPGQFDLVWCGSLVTHFDTDKSVELLDLLTSHLAPGGLLGFTTQGRMWTEYIQQNMFSFLPDKDFAKLRDKWREHKDYAYIDYRGMTGFGMSLTSPGWIYDYIYNRADLTLLSFCEKAWHGTQDVTFLQKKPLESWYDWNEV